MLFRVLGINALFLSSVLLAIGAEPQPILEEEQALRLAYQNEPTGERLDALRHWRAGLFRKESTSSEKAYRDGCEAWMAGNLNAARNSWYKALILDNARKDLTWAERIETEHFFARSDDLLRVEFQSNETEAVIDSSSMSVVAMKPLTNPTIAALDSGHHGRKKSGHRPKKKDPSSDVVRLPPDIALLLKKADVAIENGHLEAALRVLKAALRAQPDRSDIRNRIAALKTEIGSPEKGRAGVHLNSRLRE